MGRHMTRQELSELDEQQTTEAGRLYESALRILCSHHCKSMSPQDALEKATEMAEELMARVGSMIELPTACPAGANLEPKESD